MNIYYNHHVKNSSLFIISVLLMVACASEPKTPAGLNDVRDKLARLQENTPLATQAPVEIKDAEAAVRDAEKPTRDSDVSEHLVWIADRKVDIASAQAQTRLLESQRKDLSEAREKSRLDSRTREADQAHGDANNAKLEAELARQRADDLQRQIADMNAKATDRGLVVTLGDVLFETDKSELRGGAVGNLNKLAAFLTKYPDRTVAIEGHTDSVGSDDYNLGLSQRRANSVLQFLQSQGIAANRLSAVGKGENFPVASNETVSGRQMNRRVEVIIANTLVSAK